jgi:hypothetical protein
MKCRIQVFLAWSCGTTSSPNISVLLLKVTASTMLCVD